MRTITLAAAALAATPALAPALAQEAGVRPYWFDKPVIEAMGRAEIDARPNRASFSVVFIEQDEDTAEAMQAAVARARLAYDAVKQAAPGDASRIRTSVSVAPYFEQYRDREGNRIEDDRPDRVAGYEARVAVDVTVTDVALAGRARAATLALSPEESGGGVSTWLEQSVEQQRAALEAAAKDAAERARLTAAAVGKRVGELLVLQEGYGPCMGNWSSGQIAKVGGGGSGFGFPPPPPPPPPAPAMAMAEMVVTGSARGREITVTQADIDALNLPNDETPQTLSASVCAVFLVE
jgi:hypothetical protein